ncbi:MAG TPA: NAD(P)H-dependent oxidoreductase [Polyangiaceae bacterium]|nr:NAD(P)H-dependent oxidoreductase [Polyangiaceae bacterium]
MPARILVFSGSARQGSLNQRLADLAARALGEAGGEVTRLSLRDYPLPIYDGDEEEAGGGPPENARRLHEIFRSHGGVFIASPEYNAGVTPLLKNTLDWVSRVRDHGGQAAAFGRPVFALGAASPGGFGGYRGLMVLRQTLTLGLSATVLPAMASVSAAHEAFDAAGDLKSERSAKSLRALAAQLVAEAGKVGG